MQTQKYNFWVSFTKMLIKVGALATPLVLALLPNEWVNLTLGGALYMLLDFLQKKYTTI